MSASVAVVVEVVVAARFGAALVAWHVQPGAAGWPSQPVSSQSRSPSLSLSSVSAYSETPVSRGAVATLVRRPALQSVVSARSRAGPVHVVVGAVGAIDTRASRRRCRCAASAHAVLSQSGRRAVGLVVAVVVQAVGAGGLGLDVVLASGSPRRRHEVAVGVGAVDERRRRRAAGARVSRAHRRGCNRAAALHAAVGSAQSVTLSRSLSCESPHVCSVARACWHRGSRCRTPGWRSRGRRSGQRVVVVVEAVVADAPPAVTAAARAAGAAHHALAVGVEAVGLAVAVVVGHVAAVVLALDAAVSARAVGAARPAEAVAVPCSRRCRRGRCRACRCSSTGPGAAPSPHRGRLRQSSSAQSMRPLPLSSTSLSQIRSAGTSPPSCTPGRHNRSARCGRRRWCWCSLR